VPAEPTRSLSVLVLTYEWPEALDVVLRAYAEQTDPDFDVVVADDGSRSTTADLVREWSGTFGDRLVHVWQPDEGSRAARIRNIGATAARGDFLVFVDGDCIPRSRFVAAIRRAALPGWFLAGKRVQLDAGLTGAVLAGRAEIARRSTLSLVLRHGRDLSPIVDLTARDRRRPWRPELPDFTPTDNEYGFLIGVARRDLERANGFDMRFVGWGEQDVDLAVRLGRLGLRCGYAGPDSTMLHLWHPSRMTVERETWHQLQETLQSDRIEAVAGLRELANEKP
jgi:GT2 family glycosyltransferase